MNQEERKTAIRRMRVLVAAACILMLLYGLRLIFLQLVNGDDFKSQATNTTDYKFTVTAARGDIVDSRGERIATSVTGYNVVLNKLLMGDEDLDGMLQKIVELLRANGESWNDTLLISQPDAAGNYTFTAEEGSTRDQKALAAMKDNLGLQQYATANDVMEKLVEDYDLASFPLSWQRTLGGIHYEMQLQAFSNVNNFIMAENVSEATVATIKEHSLSLPGVEIVETSTRSYEQSTVLPHVLGRVGKIYREEYEELKDQGYGLNDTIGKDGLEKAYESYLRGIDGEKAVETNINGDVINETETKEPQPGSNVILTLDLDLQAVAEESLASTIQSIKERGQRNHSSGWDVEGGAAVVIDIDTGGILACASYPTYNLATFNQDYQMLYDDPLKPMFNRAIMGAYPPGSTFKPVTALAALESGTITTSTKIRDEGVYTYYASSGYTPACWIWNDKRGTHGLLDVSGALKYSCNYFFYEASRLMGIDTLNYYAKQLGLGEKTGVELPGEVAGNLAGPESREANGETWWPGETLQAAIGQSEQQFTPIQMANYMATILNGGTRYRPHFLKQVVSYDYTQVVEEYEPEVLAEMDISESTIEAIKEGMRGVVTDDGTAASVFRDYPIAVGGKTGSAQTTASKSQSAHGVFISLAPYDDPQIAVFVLVEHGGSGGNVAPIVRDIYDAYFGKQTNPDPAPQENTLIY